MKKEFRLHLLKQMLRIRTFENHARELYMQEKIRGFLHLYNGQEAVATGVIENLSASDNVVGTYREHAHALIKGLSSREIMAEMFGKQEGCSRGRGGSMHLYSSRKKFFGGNAIVGSGISHAVGLGLAMKYKNENRHTVCFFGDGAIAEGDFHESLNMASLWSIPVLFCCENNYYAMGTAFSRHQAQVNLVKKVSCGYKIESSSVDGMDVESIFLHTQEVLKKIKETGRPHFIEFKTYRFQPHSMYDPDIYRTREEIQSWMRLCPIQNLKKKLFENYQLDEKQFNEIENAVVSEIRDAILFAENGTFEKMESLLGGKV